MIQYAPDHADLYDTAWLRVSHNAVFWNSQAYSIDDYSLTVYG